MYTFLIFFRRLSLCFPSKFKTLDLICYTCFISFILPFLMLGISLRMRAIDIMFSSGVFSGAFHVAQWWGIHLPMQEMWVWSLGWEGSLEEEMTTHSSTFAWIIPWTKKPGGLQSMRLQRGIRKIKLRNWVCTHVFSVNEALEMCYKKEEDEMYVLSCFRCVQLCVTLWTATGQAPLSIGFSRQEYWSGLTCPPPGDLPDWGIEPAPVMSPALVGRFFITSATWEAPRS